MKILLIGEFSGVHNNLKKGLISLGHDVKLAAEGDSYRKFSYDYNIAPFKGRFFGRILNVFYFITNLKKFVGHDIIQFINPFSIPYYFHFLGLTYLIFRFNKAKVYYVCGTDPSFINAKHYFKYFPFDDKNNKEFKHFEYNFLSKSYYNFFTKNINCIIPSMYSYYIGYSSNSKISTPVPLPGSLLNRNEGINLATHPIKIIHGITRENFKGSKFIINALNQIKEKYKEKVEISLVKNLTINEYLNLLIEADIVVDQCKSYDYGMNAIFAMEHGCIVLSGAEKEAINYLNFDQCPVINILPEVDNIFSKLDEILSQNNAEIDEHKLRSLKFVQSNHSVYLSAKKFIRIYESL